MRHLIKFVIIIITYLALAHVVERTTGVRIIP